MWSYFFKVLLKEQCWDTLVLCPLLQKKLHFLLPSFLSTNFYSRPESKQEPVKTEMGPPPSPASTCSDASSIASSASMPYSK